MSIDGSDIESITELELQNIVSNQVPEGLTTEYKRDLYGNSDADKKEFLKDISSFANSHGGLLIIGIEEENGIPISVEGLTQINTDDTIQRFESLCRDGVEPRITGIRIHALALQNGNNVILIRVPKSWNPPHRVKTGNSNRFWIRNSNGVHEASVEELRNMFNLSGTAIEQAKKFSANRLSDIINNDSVRPLVGGGRLLLHIIPISAFLSYEQIDLELAHENHLYFQPIGSSGWSPRYNFDGFIIERGGGENSGYTQIYRNGIIEATYAGLVRENENLRFIPGAGIEEYFFQVFSGYINGLKLLNVSTPLIMIITLEGVQGAVYAVDRNLWGEYRAPLDRNILKLPECVLENYGSNAEHHLSIKPAFDALWNAIGRSENTFFNEDGLWGGGR